MLEILLAKSKGKLWLEVDRTSTATKDLQEIADKLPKETEYMIVTLKKWHCPYTPKNDTKA